MSNALTDRSERTGSVERRQLNKPRIAEIIADSLRRRILGGALADGDALPKMDDLVVEFPVSRPSIREAMRILETEGLISVRRGNIGGAVVHTPKAQTAGYMLGVVLQARRTPLSDLADALLEFEPACAAKAAATPDRNEILVPQLVALNQRLEENLADGPAFTRLARRFHDAVVHGSGNTTMALVVGALETLWSDHESNWAEAASAHGDYPVRAARNAVLQTHKKITQAIEEGDAARATHLAARHLHESQRYVLAKDQMQLVTVSGSAKVS
jgi:GntR family transcriptional regulator, transcriptional repressor for pyruvate dehydrogenase complex